MAAAAAIAVPAALAAPGGDDRAGSPDGQARPATAPAAVAARPRERVRLGRSARGRRIDAVRLGNPVARRTVLVVGAVHGDEPAGRAVARSLETGSLPRRTDLWVVRDLNPDGHAADPAVERRVSRLLGLPLRRLPRYSGTAIAWQRSELPRSDGLVVELGAGRPGRSQAERVARALRRLAP